MADINVQISPAQLVSKKQNHFVAKCSLIAGSIFALIFVASFLIGRYAFEKLSLENANILIILGAVSLFVSVILSLVLSFRGLRASIGFISATIGFFSISFTLMFSSFFSLIANDILFYSLAFTAIALIITGIISYLIPAKAAFSVAKIGSISFIIYLVVAVIGSLIINLTWDGAAFQVWHIILSAILGLSIICTSIFTLYSMKKTSEFINIGEIDRKTQTKLLLFQSFNLLSCIVMAFSFILRIVGLVNSN